MTCISCGGPAPSGGTLCGSCGASNASATAGTTCSGCGSAITLGATQCEYCGREVDRTIAADRKISFNFGSGEKSISLSGGNSSSIQGLFGKITRPSPQFSPSGAQVPSSLEPWQFPPSDSFSRILGGLIDLAIIFFAAGVSYGVLGIAYVIWAGVAMGNGGQSLGHRVAGQYVVDAQTKRPIGPGRGVIRYFLHILDFVLIIGYIIGIATGQCFADRIMHTIVVKRPTTKTYLRHLPPPPGTA
jgi:uncharacterized RDD family membrane protein YckC